MTSRRGVTVAPRMPSRAQAEVIASKEYRAWNAKQRLGMGPEAWRQSSTSLHPRNARPPLSLGSFRRRRSPTQYWEMLRDGPGAPIQATIRALEHVASLAPWISNGSRLSYVRVEIAGDDDWGFLHHCASNLLPLNAVHHDHEARTSQHFARQRTRQVPREIKAAFAGDRDGVLRRRPSRGGKARGGYFQIRPELPQGDLEVRAAADVAMTDDEHAARPRPAELSFRPPMRK